MVTNAGLFSLTIRASGGEVVAKRDWYRNFDLPAEAERGLDSIDSHLCVGEVTMPLTPDNGVGSLRALNPSRRLISRARCAAVSTMTERPSRPRGPTARQCGRRPTGLPDLRSPPMLFCFLDRFLVCPMVNLS